MRLTEQNIENAVLQAVGKEALPIVEYLKERRNISDFKIAEKTGLRIQKARNLLYQLHANNIVKYVKRKDEAKGWYISYFSFDKKGTKLLIERQRKQNLEKYQDRLKVEDNGNLFFMCPNYCVRLNMDGSAEYNYHCPECGSLLNQQDNSKTVEFLKNKIHELETTG